MTLAALTKPTGSCAMPSACIPACIVAKAPSVIWALTWPIWATRREPVASGSSGVAMPRPMPRVTPACASVHWRRRVASGAPKRAAVTEWPRDWRGRPRSARWRGCPATSRQRRPRPRGPAGRGGPRPAADPLPPRSSSGPHAGRTGGGWARCRTNIARTPPGWRGGSSSNRASAGRLVLQRSAALSENQTKPMPGGVIMPFWLAATVTSTPQSSMQNTCHSRWRRRNRRPAGRSGRHRPSPGAGRQCRS